MTEKKTTTLADVLRGCAPGRVQTVGAMQIIPLLSEVSYDEFAPLSDLRAEEMGYSGGLRVSTSNYGTLVFRNIAPAPMIVPRDAGFLTKSSSQDHVTPEVTIIPAEQTVQFDRAACIQASQSGYIQEGDHQLIILPFPLREANLALRKQNEYSKLWPTITAFNRYMGASGRKGHIEVFLNKYRQQLEQFVAEFEPVPDQVGVIVIVNGKVAGIERVPSHGYWLDVWETLIRECYGSLALYIQRADVPITRQKLEGTFSTIGELYNAVIAAEQSETDRASTVVRALTEEPLTIEDETEASGLTIQTFSSDQFVGQSVKEGAKTIYASMTATALRLKEAAEAVEAFTI